MRLLSKYLNIIRCLREGLKNATVAEKEKTKTGREKKEKF